VMRSRIASSMSTATKSRINTVLAAFIASS
jgi:hypothetical protein